MIVIVIYSSFVFLIKINFGLEQKIIQHLDFKYVSK